MSLCDLAGTPGAGSIEVTAPTLIVELVDVAELYVNPCRGDALHDMATWRHGAVVDWAATQGDFGGQGGAAARHGVKMRGAEPVPATEGFAMRLSIHDPAAAAAAFERADAIVALDSFLPDADYRAIRFRVIACDLTSVQAVQLVIEQAQAADRALVATRAI